MSKRSYLGIDVGGKRKGFNVVVLEGTSRPKIVRAERRLAVKDVVDLVEETKPRLIAMDCPVDYAAPGSGRRESEKDFYDKGICGIRWTPDLKTMQNRSDNYYGWILHGKELLDKLNREDVIEVFPTAALTQWSAPRVGSRAKWSTAIIEGLGLAAELTDAIGSRRPSQDDRDALAAALNAWQYSRSKRSQFSDLGSLVVPKPGRLVF